VTAKYLNSSDARQTLSVGANTYIVKGPFWALATEWMSAGVAAAAIAQVNAIGNIGGFLGSYLLGVIKDATGSYSLGLLPLAVLSGAGCFMVLALSRNQQQNTTVVQESAA
jgi:ACS family tartrate transporter-like MFS transporter